MPYSSEEEMKDSVSRTEHQPSHVALPVGTNSEEQKKSEDDLLKVKKRTRAASVADEQVVIQESKFSASREDAEDSLSETVEVVDDAIDKTAALMSAVHLDISAIAFNAAKQGDSELLEVLLGPSLPNEKDEFIRLSAQRAAREDQKRIYEFMLDVTKARIAEVTDFDSIPSDYKDYKKLSIKLNSLVSDCIARASERYNADEKLFSQCIELNDYSRDKVVLEADEMLPANKSLVTESAVPMKTVLMGHGVTISATDRYASFYLSDTIKKAMELIWVDRFVYRSVLMVFPVVENAKSYELKKKGLVNESHIYGQYILQCESDIRNLDNEIQSYTTAYLTRCRRQLSLIDALLTDQRYELSPELIGLINKVKVTILFKMGDARYKHLAGAADEPRRCWVSPHIKNATGSTMLHVAVQRKRYKSAYVLKSHGLMLNTKNRKGKTPADLSGYEEDELNRIIQKYARVTDSAFLKEVEEVVLKYLAKSNKTLNSVPRTLLYRIFHDINILRTRVNHEIPRYRQKIQETRQSLDDMPFALSALKYAKDAQKGLRNRSELHQSIIALVDQYLDIDNNYGVKPLDEVARIGIAPQGSIAQTKALAAARAESDRQLQVIVQQSELIARLEGENQDLSGKLDKARDFAAEQSKKIASQDAKIDEQSEQIKTQANELDALKATVTRQGSDMQAMQDSIAQMREMMLMIQGQQATQQAMPRVSSPIPIVVKRVSVNPNTLYAPSAEAPATPALEQDGIPMNSFSPSE